MAIDRSLGRLISLPVMNSPGAGSVPQLPERADHLLRTIGLYCPIPIIKTAARMKRMTAGEILEVVSSDRVILDDMPAWCRSTGNDYLGFRQEGERQWHLFVRKIKPE